MICVLLIIGQLEFDDIGELSAAILFLATQIAFLAKLTSIIYYKNNFRKIESILAKPAFKKFTPEQIDLIIQDANGTEFIAKNYRYICAISVLCYSIFPFLDKRSDYSMPLPAWNIWDVKKSRIFYWISFHFQIISIAISALYNSAIDIITVKMYTLATSQFRILKSNLEDIDYTAETVHQELRNNLIYHQDLLSFIQLIQETFSYGIFVQFIASVLVICFVFFEMLIVPIFSMEFVHLIMYLGCMVNQVVLYCWYGHGIMTEVTEKNSGDLESQ